MSNSVSSPAGLLLSGHVAAEVRSLLARQGSSIRALADQLDVSHHYLARRLGAARTVALDLDDFEKIAAALGVTPADLLPTP